VPADSQRRNRPEIPFHDVDMMVWHGHYAKYFEIARRLLEQIDYNYPQTRDSGYAWPVIDSESGT
jgi:acyl-CoA thioester hydrolase